MRVAFACLVACLPLASAGSAAKPEGTDPSGDVAAFGVPVPAGLEWGDIRAAWFETANGTLRVHIQVGGEQPPQGEVGVTFLVGDQHWISGFTVVPGLYAGGFLSRSDENGDVPADVQPEGVDGTWADGLITAEFPLAKVDDGGNLTALETPWAWSESEAANGESRRLDRTEVGAGYSWAAPQESSTPPTRASQPAPAPLGILALGLGLLCRAACGATRRESGDCTRLGAEPCRGE